MLLLILCLSHIFLLKNLAPLPVPHPLDSRTSIKSQQTTEEMGYNKNDPVVTSKAKARQDWLQFEVLESWGKAKQPFLAEGVAVERDLRGFLRGR